MPHSFVCRTMYFYLLPISSIRVVVLFHFMICNLLVSNSFWRTDE